MLNVDKLQNSWLLGLSPSYNILKHREHHIWKLDLFLSSGEGETHALLHLIEKANSMVFRFLEYRTMDRIQKSNNLEYYTPLPEPCRI
jgi:hypothetical protein